MSLDQNGDRWCDKCRDERANTIAWNRDGSRTDLCAKHEDMHEAGAYVTEIPIVRENWGVSE